MHTENLRVVGVVAIGTSVALPFQCKVIVCVLEPFVDVYELHRVLSMCVCACACMHVCTTVCVCVCVCVCPVNSLCSGIGMWM